MLVLCVLCVPCVALHLFSLSFPLIPRPSRLFRLRGKIWNGRKLVRWRVYLVYFNQWSVLKRWLIWKKGGLLLFLEPALFILVVTAYFSKLVKGFAGFLTRFQEEFVHPSFSTCRKTIMARSILSSMSGFRNFQLTSFRWVERNSFMHHDRICSRSFGQVYPQLRMVPRVLMRYW